MIPYLELSYFNINSTSPTLEAVIHKVGIFASIYVAYGPPSNCSALPAAVGTQIVDTIKTFIFPTCTPPTNYSGYICFTLKARYFTHDQEIQAVGSFLNGETTIIHTYHVH